VAGVASLLLTFLAVLVAQIFFRADSVRQAASLISGMLGLHHAAAIQGDVFQATHGVALRLLLGFFIVWCLPNTQQILARFHPALQLTSFDLERPLLPFAWRPSPAWGLALGAILFFTLTKMQVTSTFLYFQF
jgi:alginate O-acetyltransferase complex protein AlgI